MNVDNQDANMVTIKYPENIYAVINENYFGKKSIESGDNYASWRKNQKVYLSIEVLAVSLNFVCSSSFIVLSLWLMLSTQHAFLSNLANQTKYTSLDKFNIGYLSFVCLVIGTVSLLIDCLHLFLFFKIRNKLLTYTKAHDLTMRRFMPVLSFRKRIHKFVLLIKLITYSCDFIYILILIPIKLFIAIWIRVGLHSIVYRELPNSIWKLLKEYETLVDANDATRYESTEYKLVNKMHKAFDCCHYTSPYQYQTHADLIYCNVKQACLKPVQYFVFNYFYYILIFIFINSILNLMAKIMQVFNFNRVLIKKLLYYYKTYVWVVESSWFIQRAVKVFLISYLRTVCKRVNKYFIGSM